MRQFLLPELMVSVLDIDVVVSIGEVVVKDLKAVHVCLLTTIESPHLCLLDQNPSFYFFPLFLVVVVLLLLLLRLCVFVCYFYSLIRLIVLTLRCCVCGNMKLVCLQFIGELLKIWV